MITLVGLWLPILVAAVAVFFASFLMWSVLPHHRKDWQPLADEDEIMGALRKQGMGQGQYLFPHGVGNEAMRDPAYIKKYSDGPAGILVIREPGGFHMGKCLTQSFLFNLVISVVVAYIASFTLTAASDGKAIMRLTGTVAFLGYAGALAWEPIWWGRSWASTCKGMFDGAVYALATGAVFMLLWP